MHVDVCRNGACAHEEVPHPVTCTPVQGAFRRALALQSLARLLMTDGAARVESSAAPLRRVDASLGAAARALAGKSVGAVAGRPLPAVFTETPATERARTAFTMVLRTPGQVTAFLQMLAQARVRALLGRAVNRDLRRRGRLLLQGTRKLKAELRWLQQLTATFAR